MGKFEVPYPSPLAFDRLHDDIMFCCMTLVPGVIFLLVQVSACFFHQSDMKHVASQLARV